MRYTVRNFTLFSLFKIALKHIVVLILVAVIAGSAAFAYCTYIATPEYSATGYVLVTNGGIINGGNSSPEDYKTNNSDISASSNLLNTIIDILKTNDIYKKLSDELDNSISFSSLSARSSVRRKSDNSLFIAVSFSANDPKEAMTLVNKYLEIAPEYISDFVKGTATSVTKADYAGKTYPHTLTTTMLATVCSVGVVYFIILLIYSTNTIIRDEEDFKQRFDVPVIGCVPDFNQARSNKSYYKYYKRSGYYGRK